MEQELLSIVEILREYRNILLGHKIIIYTDHKNLSFSNFNSARVTRWRLIVEEFGPEIRYIKGSSNIVADALSRHPRSSDMEAEEEVFAQALEEPEEYPLSFATFAKYQQDLDKTDEPETYKTKLEMKERGNWSLIHHEDRIYVPKVMRQAVIDFYHQMLRHPGMTRTYMTMRPHLSWPKMKEDIERAVAECAICKEWKRGDKSYGKIPVKTPDTKPWEVVCVDLIGPYPIKGNDHENGKFWALMMIDPILGWFEAEVIMEKSSATVGNKFDTTWLCRYPRPLYCIHDQGTEFTGPGFQNILCENGIQCKPTSVRNPQANAILKRLHQVIGNQFRTSVTDEEDRRESLPSICYAIRATYKTTARASPAQLTFGRDMMMDTNFTADWKRIQDRKWRQVQIDNARENEKRIDYQYKEGDQVYLMQDTKHQGKMKRPTLGPFPIVQIRNNGTVIIRRGNYCETVNIRRL